LVAKEADWLRPIDEDLLLDAVAYVDRWVEYRQRTNAVPGIAIAVGHRGRVLLSRAYGMADLEDAVPLTTEHVFRVASHSKMFTATAVMQLVERGALRLDDRAGDLLPWLPGERGQLGRVTVRQLLSHSAGVIRDGEDGAFWQLERDFPSADELREVFRGTPPVLPENRQFKYSNFGYSLLGLAVESAAGTPYNAYVKREIVDRLGLRGTGPELDDYAREHLATGYTGDHYGLPRLPLEHQDTAAMSPATGFYSTPEDLCRFAAAHFPGNEELLTDESKREMQRAHWKVDQSPLSYGLGLDVASVGERVLLGHGGGFPGFITSTKFDPADQLVLVALTNAADGPAAELTTGMAAIVNRAMEAGPPPAETDGVDLDRFTGRFWSLGAVVDVVRFGGQLLGLSPELPNPVDPVVELTAEGPEQLRISKAPGFSSPGERVRYSFDGEGRVDRVRWAAAALYPWETFQASILPSVRATRRAPLRE
jgi:CubicO group peptidase (beta-lactamase class C family)